jgi:hypothetical protein
MKPVFRILNRKFLGILDPDPSLLVPYCKDPDPSINKQKINLDCYTVLWRLNDLLSLALDVKVPTVQYSVVEPKIFLSAPRSRRSELRLRLQLRSRLQIIV